MCSIKAECDRQIFKISLIEFCQIFDQIAKLATLPSGDLKEKLWCIFMFFNFFQNICNIMSHVFVSIGNVIVAFSFTHVHVDRFKTCMMSNLKIMENTFDISLTFLKRLRKIR